MLKADTFLNERFELAMIRICEIENEQSSVADADFPWEDYFVQMADWMTMVHGFIRNKEEGELEEWTFDQWNEFYGRVYAPIREGYEKSYANPDVAGKAFGEDYGRILSVLASEIYRSFSWYMMGNNEAVVSLWEVFVEIYTAFDYGVAEQNRPKAEDLQKIMYWYVSDYSDEMVSWRIHEQYEPDFSPIKSIILNSDLNDLRYLYHFGEYVSDIEVGTAKHMNALSE